jgi:hypothetical protein
MKANEHVSAVPEDMANACPFAVSPVGNQKVSFLDGVPLKIFPHFRTGDGEGIASKVRQLEAVVNPPIASRASGFTHCSPVHNAHPKLAAESVRKLGASKVFCDPLGHPPEPALGGS